MDEWEALGQGIKSAGEWLTTITVCIAMLTFLLELVRGRGETRSFRPFRGWLVSVLGLFTTLTVIFTLRARELLPFAAGAVQLGVVLVLAIGAVIAGTLTALLAPSAGLPVLRQIASATEAMVRQCEADSGFVRSTYVSLRMTASYVPAWSGEAKTLRCFGAAKLVPASVSVVTGPAGCGKSVELRQHVLSQCHKVLQRRRPHEIAIYVPVRALPEITGPITQDTVYAQIKASVADGNAMLADQLTQHLDVTAAGPSWLFVFDLDAELPRDREQHYFEAVRNFMRHRGRDYAVIAMRENLASALPVFTPELPDRRRVHELLDKQRIPLKAVRHPLDSVTPAMITQFGSHMVQEHALDSYVSSRLNRHSALGRSEESLRTLAEEVAYRMLVDDDARPAQDADVAPLLAAQLGCIERGAFAFRFAALEVHLAAAHLVSARLTTPLEDLVRNDITREMLVTALRSGDKAFVESVVREIQQLVRARADLPADLATTDLPPVGSFRWPPVVQHALAVLRDADRHGVDLKVSDRQVIDYLVWQGAFSGGKHERETALSLLNLASPQRVLAIYRQAMTLGYDARTTSLIAIHVRFDPQSSDRPTLRERYEMLTRGLTASAGEKLPLRRGSGLLVSLMAGLVTRARVSALLWATLLFIWAIVSDTTSAAVGLSVIAVLVSTAAWSLRGHAEERGPWMVLVLQLLTILSLFMCFLPSVLYFVAFVAAVTSDGERMIHAFALLIAHTFPLFLMAQLLHDPVSDRHWGKSHFVLFALPHYREEWGKQALRLKNRFSHLRSKRRITAIAVMVTSFVVLPVNLPMDDGRERYAEYVWLALVIVAILVVVLWRIKDKPVPVDVLGRQIADRDMTEGRLMEEIAGRAERGLGEFGQLLKVLATAPPGALDSCVRVLQSLDRLLEFLERTLPTPTKMTIHSAVTPDMWRYAPELNPSGLAAWAVDFDRKHPGFLVKLANSESARKALSNAIDNATRVVPRSSVTGAPVHSPAS